MLKPTSKPVMRKAEEVQDLLMDMGLNVFKTEGVAEFIVERNALVAGRLRIGERYALDAYWYPDEIAQALAEDYRRLLDAHRRNRPRPHD